MKERGEGRRCLGAQTGEGPIHASANDREGRAAQTPQPPSLVTR